MNCGDCLMERVEIVALNADGTCPKCGVKYDPDLVAEDGEGHAKLREALGNADAGAIRSLSQYLVQYVSDEMEKGADLDEGMIRGGLDAWAAGKDE